MHRIVCLHEDVVVTALADCTTNSHCLTPLNSEPQRNPSLIYSSRLKLGRSVSRTPRCFPQVDRWFQEIYARYITHCIAGEADSVIRLGLRIQCTPCAAHFIHWDHSRTPTIVCIVIALESEPPICVSVFTTRM